MGANKRLFEQERYEESLNEITLNNLKKILEQVKEGQELELHYKSIVWNKITLSKDIDVEDLIKRLNTGEAPDDIAFDDETATWETLYSTERLLSVEENEGEPTVELYQKSLNEPLWNNGNS